MRLERTTGSLHPLLAKVGHQTINIELPLRNAHRLQLIRVAGQAVKRESQAVHIVVVVNAGLAAAHRRIA